MKGIITALLAFVGVLALAMPAQATTVITYGRPPFPVHVQAGRHNAFNTRAYFDKIVRGMVEVGTEMNAYHGIQERYTCTPMYVVQTRAAEHGVIVHLGQRIVIFAAPGTHGRRSWRVQVTCGEYVTYVNLAVDIDSRK